MNPKELYILLSRPELQPMLIGFSFIIGACIGSFINVCAYRLPRDMSIVTPASHCPECGEPIPWYFNIPIWGWLRVGGRAACCGAKISPQYPIVEALTGIFFALLYWRTGLVLAPLYWVFVSLLMLGALTDLEDFFIPDRVTIGSFLLGVIFAAAVPALHDQREAGKAVWDALFGAAVGGGLLWLIATLGTLALRKEAMGMGDVKLLAGIGAFLGWRAALFAIALGSILGSLAGVTTMMVQQRKMGTYTSIPFGPPLMLAGILWLFGGRGWWEEYFYYFPALSGLR